MSWIILLYKLPLQSVMLGLDLKAKIFGLGLGIAIEAHGLGLIRCGLVNIAVYKTPISAVHRSKWRLA